MPQQAGEACEVVGRDRPGRWIVTCDHASNAVPSWVSNGDLGLPASDMARHIAWDVGASGLAEALAERLDGPLVRSTFSRLVIDPNRGEDDPTILMKLYDGTVVPGNRSAGPEERERRIARLWRPYHDAVESLAAARPDPVILAVHSFTPRLRGRPHRPWHVAVLSSSRDRRLADPLLARLAALPGLCVGDNEPYGGELDGDSIDRHALKSGRPNVLIELRNDLIEAQEDQLAWADRLAPVLGQALADTGL